MKSDERSLPAFFPITSGFDDRGPEPPGVIGGMGDGFVGCIQTEPVEPPLPKVQQPGSRELDEPRHRRGLKVHTCRGASIDTTTGNGRLEFYLFAALAEFEHELILERTKTGLAAAPARSRNGSRPFKLTTAKLRLAKAAMGKSKTKVAERCAELGVIRQRLYRHVTPGAACSAPTAKSRSNGATDHCDDRSVSTVAQAKAS